MCDTPEINVPENVRQAITAQGENVESKRRKRQVDDDDELQILASLELDAVKDLKAQNVEFSVLVDPEVLKFKEPLELRPFWPFSDKSFDIKVRFS